MPDNIVRLGSMQFAHVMDQMGTPAFLLDVDGPGKFRFGHISARHVSETGMDAAALLGKAPHEVLPDRLADTLVANYERCRASGVVETYDETLELPSGTRWWRTALSPIRSDAKGGDVAQILGIATDITDAKLREMKLTRELSLQVSSAEKVRAYAANAMLGTQAPMRSVLAWLEILRDGFLDLGDGKLEEMDQITQLARDAISGMDEVLHAAGSAASGPDMPVRIDLGHMCRDLAALIDPAGRLKMSLPNEIIEGDWAVTQIVLRCLLEQATRRAVSLVAVRVKPEADGLVTIVITDDSAFEQSVVDTTQDLVAAADLVQERGGSLSTTSSLKDGASVEVRLPGWMLSPDQTAATAAIPVPA